MSFIQMYLEPEDADILLSWLNDDEHIAFIKSNGPKKWIAVKTLDKLKTRNTLWHIPYSNLPLQKPYPEEPGIIFNPWNGWEEMHENKSKVPYFGTGCPGIIELDVLIDRFYIDEDRKPVDVILKSSFGWIGNYFRIIGRPALKETEIWWKRMRQRINKISKKITIHYDNKGGGYKQLDIYAFPAAAKAIENGKVALDQGRIVTKSCKVTYEKGK